MAAHRYVYLPVVVSVTPYNRALPVNTGLTYARLVVVFAWIVLVIGAAWVFLGLVNGDFWQSVIGAALVAWAWSGIRRRQSETKAVRPQARSESQDRVVGRRLPTQAPVDHIEPKTDSLGKLKGLLAHDPSPQVRLRIVSDEVLAFSADGQQFVDRFPFASIIPPATTPHEESEMQFSLRSPEWAWIAVLSPVGDEWHQLADSLRNSMRTHKRTYGSEKSSDEVVSQSSEQVQRVWYVLMPPAEGWDVGIGIDDISWQTGLFPAEINQALTDLDGLALIERNVSGDYRRVAGADGQSGT